MSDTVLNLSYLSKSFISGESKITILDSLDLEIKKGESVAITGPSGCGKSTLLNIIGTLEDPDSGKVLINGVNLSDLEDDGKAELRLNEIGFVFQKHHLLPQLTALENILLPTLKKKNNDATSYAKELLGKVGLTERANHRPGQLSGGECQRVALCRALINRPSILLADEPTGALDSTSSDQLLHLLTSLNKEEELTILSVTHSVHFANAMQLNYKLINGKLEKADA